MSLNLYLLRMAHNLKIGEYVPPSIDSHQAALIHLLLWQLSTTLTSCNSIFIMAESSILVNTVHTV